MNKNIDISFIIPCLNGKQFIYRCLDSLLGLKSNNWEAVIVDNGSDDGSYELLLSYAKRDRRFIVLKSNKKCQSTAKNIAVKNASGKYVCFVDIDDAVSCDLLDAYPIDKNFDFYFSNWKKIRKNKESSVVLPMKNEFLGRDHIIKIQKWIFGDVQSRNPLSIDAFSSNCGKLYKTSIILENNILFTPMEIIGGSEDAIFNMEYLNFAMNGYFSNKELYHYYSHNNSYTHNRSLEKLFLYFSQYHIMQNIIKKFELDNIYDTLLKNRLIIVSLPVFIVASRLNIKRKEKFDFYKKYLSYTEFDEASKLFSAKKFGVVYKFLYHFLIKKHYKLLYYMLRVTDAFYNH